MSSISYVTGWAAGRSILNDEIQQLKEEGRDAQWIEALLAKEQGRLSQAELWEALQAAPMRPDFPFNEPSDLESIRREREVAKHQYALALSPEDLQDRMLGAWLGRCCGCALGKPVERFMGGHDGMPSWELIKIYLQGIAPAEYPLNNYFPLHSSAEGKTGAVHCHPSCRENIAFMESDDDIRYTVIGQQVLLQKGTGFTTRDVMEAWLHTLTYEQVCTAETQAYRNYILRYHVRCRPAQDPNAEPADWSWVATYQNPYREWIGAQIRADSWGYAAPGNPELAAEFAWRDACMSHVKNGIYGEMFVAAMIAAGFALKDPLAVVEAGLAEIPKASRLHRDMRETIAICQKHGCDAGAFEKVFGEIQQLLNHYSPVHTNNNAALVVAALLLGGDDFEKAITLAVMGGWDTDCNGATVGSIFGAMYGAGSIPSKWKAPLNDTLYAEVGGYHPIAISECARRSVEIARKIVG